MMPATTRPRGVCSHCPAVPPLKSRGRCRDWYNRRTPQLGQCDVLSDVAVVPKALETAGVAAKDLAGIGVTNQRETVLVWERAGGKPVTRAIVWQDRRTSDFCRDRKSDEDWIYRRTGLVLDPYFSGTK